MNNENSYFPHGKNKRRKPYKTVENRSVFVRYYTFLYDL